MADKKLKWETPELVNLNKKVTHGVCLAGGTYIAAITCNVGNDALTTCVGGSAVGTACTAGPGGTLV